MDIVILENGQKMLRTRVGEAEILTPYQEVAYIEPEIVEDKPSQVEIDFAEYVLATEERMAILESKLEGGSK